MDSLPAIGNHALWAVFEPAFYRTRYASGLPDANMPDEALEAFYHATGAALGHAPNRFFAETWYRQAYSDAAAQIEAGTFSSAFAHYLATGFIDRSPHWLFSHRFYLAGNPDLTRTRLEEAGYRNAYDHYLCNGDREFRAGHLFFDPQMFAASLPGADFSKSGPFATFLSENAATPSITRLSWYFDPEWYTASYPAIAPQIKAGQYSCALEHYLYNPTPRAFDPSPHFSEDFYTSVNVDLTAAIESGQFRNGYDHFIQFGVFECRKPHPNIDLATYFRAIAVQADIQNGLCRDVFAHYISKFDTSTPTQTPIEINEQDARHLFALHARQLRPSFARTKIDFSLAEPPAISVIVVMFNKLDFTLMALDSLRRNFPGPIELILADSGSTDGSRHIEHFVTGAKIIRFNHNAGFLESCNAALAHVTAPATLYMNNDILIDRGAVAAAITRLESSPDIGAVGGKIIRTHGSLQEAGCIIWRDGSTQGYMRGADPNIPEANFVRNVDFCSGVFLAVRTEILKTLGGFDPRFKPAYFEETDLCIRLYEAGYRTVYDPGIMITHHEYSSSDSATANLMMAQNRPIFRKKHQEYLRTRFPRNDDLMAQARSPRTRHKRILFIEDRIPLRHLGSGFTRSNDIIATMAALGHQVTIFPIYRPIENTLNIYGDFADTVEIIHDRELLDLKNFLGDRTGYFDILWIARTHNAERLLDILMSASRHLPINRIVLDTEAIAAVRASQRAAITGAKPTETLDEAVQRELASAYFCQKIVAVNEQDAATIRAAGSPNVAILGHTRKLNPTPAKFEDRRGILFLGAIHDADSPNLDGLEWFIDQVLPILDTQLPEDADITIAGYANRRIDLSQIGLARRVSLAGHTQDLCALFNRHRVFFAPTRFAAGIPLKLHESAAFGLPIATTDLLATQLGWTHNQDLLAAPPTEPAGFAANIIRLYSSPELWQTIRDAALSRIATENSPEIYQQTLAAILTDLDA